MSDTDITKQKVIEQYRLHNKDTGSIEVQVALLTNRINQLTEHFKVHKKDANSRRGLIVLTSRRRKLLNYLKRTDLEGYNKLTDALHIRRRA